MSYAIIEESGGQRKVVEGDEILVDLMAEGLAKQGDTVTFDNVLVLGGDSTRIGLPYVDGASVTGEIIEPVVKGEKLYIYKFRAKKGYRRKTGHRQRYTKVKVTQIIG